MTKFLLRAVASGDDTSLAFRRYDGNGRSNIVCFLPWMMPCRLAQGMGLVPHDHLAAYEMPAAIVSSEPALCIKALDAVVDDACRLIERKKVPPSRLIVLGYSIGTAAATYFANRIGAQLWSIASADRGDLMLWESDAARTIKQRAVAKGYKLADFTEATRGYHPVDNLGNLGRNSRFVIGTRDEWVPKPRRDGLVRAVRRERPCADIAFLETGHVRTLIGGVTPWFARPPEDEASAA